MSDNIEAFIGIDYGTSTCKLAYATAPLNQRASLPSIENISFAISGVNTTNRYPSSFVFVKKRNNKYELKSGFQAAKLLENQKELNKSSHFIVRSPKLDMGKGIFYPFGPAEYSEPLDLVSLTINQILHEFEQTGIKRRKVKVLITVPSSFGVQQRNEMLSALEKLKVDIDESNLIDEPNAALLGMIPDPLFSTAIRRANNNKILIIDYGAGTCDISLLEIKEDLLNEPYGISIQNLSINDYTEFGGNLIDKQIASLVIPQLLNNSQRDILDKDDFIRQMVDSKISDELSADITRKQKEEMIQILLRSQSSKSKVHKRDFKFRIETIKLYLNQLKEEFVFPRNNRVIIGIYEFEELIYDLINNDSAYSISGLVNNVLDKAESRIEDLGAVLFVGGSSRIFQVKQFQETLLKTVFKGMKSEQILFPKDPDLLISRGAAIECYNRYHLKKSLIRPICPSTIGIKTVEDEFITLIEGGRGLPIPNQEDRTHTATLYAPNIVKRYNSMQVPLYVKRFGRLVPFQIWTIDLPSNIGPNEKLLFDTNMDINKRLTVTFRSFKNPTDLFHITCQNYLSTEEPTKREIKINELRLRIKEQKKNNDIVNQKDLYDLLLLEKDTPKHRATAKERALQFLELQHFDIYGNAFLFNILGLIADIVYDYKQAVSYYKKAVQLRPDNYVYNYNVGVKNLWNLENYLEAEKYLQESIKYNPSYYSSHMYLGSAKLKIGKEVEAKDEFRIALELVKKQFELEPTREVINAYAKICDNLTLQYPEELKAKLLEQPISPDDELDQLNALGSKANIIRAYPDYGE